MNSEPVAITIVTYNSSRYIATCLEHALRQDYSPLEIVVVDNASSDGTTEILRSFEDRVQVIFNAENRGFAAGQNQAIAAAPNATWILTLNPDVRLTADFTRTLLITGNIGAETGSVCGKLLAARPDLSAYPDPLLDSTSIYFTPSLRHLDRGNGLPDFGQYENVEYVFGGTGAACLYRRSMIDDISVAGEFFDTDFFAYREDADVAWRAQLLGWKCIYTPHAIAWHVRAVVPGNRRSQPPTINMHSVKNRWLMRLKNMTPGLYRRYWANVTARDMVVIGGCVLREWTSLPAFLFVARNLRRTLTKRRQIMRCKRADDTYLAAWFSNRPVSFPVLPVAAETTDQGRKEGARR